MAARPTKQSAGILMFRHRPSGPEVLLGHPGGPFWAGKDNGVWSIPKGEYPPEEDAIAAARREFAEEVGRPAPDGPYLDLGSVVQRNRKRVSGWAVEGELDPADAVSNTCTIEWPPRSGRRLTIPELDRVAWFDLATARVKMNPAQVGFLDRLVALVA